MCKERRATFQKVAMDEDGTVHPCFSVNLTKVQMVISILVGLFALLTSMVGAVALERG